MSPDFNNIYGRRIQSFALTKFTRRKMQRTRTGSLPCLEESDILFRMIRLRLAIGVTAALMLGAQFSFSQNAEKKAAAQENDLLAIRELIERQSKQIDALNQQVMRLSQLIEALHGNTATPAFTPAEQRPVAPPEAAPVATAVPETVAPEAAGFHVVAKGETLTSIAKHYKITVGELLKVNKIENDRKLQIGQTLAIPTLKPAEATQEKKETQ
jgi:LysM repeat protein